VFLANDLDLVRENACVFPSFFSLLVATRGFKIEIFATAFLLKKLSFAAFFEEKF